MKITPGTHPCTLSLDPFSNNTVTAGPSLDLTNVFICFLFEIGPFLKFGTDGICIYCLSRNSHRFAFQYDRYFYLFVILCEYLVDLLYASAAGHAHVPLVLFGRGR